MLVMFIGVLTELDVLCRALSLSAYFLLSMNSSTRLLGIFVHDHSHHQLVVSSNLK